MLPFAAPVVRVQGNYIGTDITGTLALGNNGNGVVAGDGALIGGTVPEARNIISANGDFGNNVVSRALTTPAPAATVQGNYIGTDVTGTRALGGYKCRHQYQLSNNHMIGGIVAGARNVISGNSIGIQLGFFSAYGRKCHSGKLHRTERSWNWTVAEYAAGHCDYWRSQ